MSETADQAWSEYARTLGIDGTEAPIPGLEEACVAAFADLLQTSRTMQQGVLSKAPLAAPSTMASRLRMWLDRFAAEGDRLPAGSASVATTEEVRSQLEAALERVDRWAGRAATLDQLAGLGDELLQCQFHWERRARGSGAPDPAGG